MKGRRVMVPGARVGGELERERLARLEYGDDCGEGERAII
jgi:hypothetical protein